MIKVNLVTGFLGSGKTTAILHLLSQKPDHEKWAILVNEFGEIGIDGALLANQGATIKEIAGGCLCCVNGLTMQMSLNRLISEVKPDRIIIEPTGIGHPKQILDTLRAPEYQHHLSLDTIVCLFDAKQLQSQAYRDDKTYRDQLAIADLLIANKADSYSLDDRRWLAQWRQEEKLTQPLIITEQGRFAVTLLAEPSHNQTQLSADSRHQAGQSDSLLSSLSLPPHQTWRRATNNGAGFHSCGWIFHPDTVFSTAQLLDWVRSIPVDRVKGVMRINEGTLIVNRQGQDLHIETRPIAPSDSRIELISADFSDWNALQLTLLQSRNE